MRKTRVLPLLVLAATVLVLFGAIVPVGAVGEAGTLIFRGVATSPGLCYPGTKTLNPNAAATSSCGPDATNSGEVRPWSLDVGQGGGTVPVNLDFCVGANHKGEVGVKVFAGPGGSIGNCDLTGSGSVKAGPAYEGAGFSSPVKAGPYCGASHGTGITSSTVGSVITTEQVEWIQSAATVLPNVDGDPNNNMPDPGDPDTNGDGIPDVEDDRVLIAGVTDAVGSFDGNCGATGPSAKFNVIGVAVAVGQ